MKLDTNALNEFIARELSRRDFRESRFVREIEARAHPPIRSDRIFLPFLNDRPLPTAEGQPFPFPTYQTVALVPIWTPRRPRRSRMAKVFVYRINDYEWWAAEDIPSLRIAYKEQTGIDPDSDEGFSGEPRVVSDEKMKQLRFRRDDEDIGGEGDIVDSEMFYSFDDELTRMILDGRQFPCVFACTEY